MKYTVRYISMKITWPYCERGPGPAPRPISRQLSSDRCVQWAADAIFWMSFRLALRAKIRSCAPDLLPAARDMIPLALAKFQSGEIQSPRQVQPVYVRDEISWKKLQEQGRSHD